MKLLDYYYDNLTDEEFHSKVQEWEALYIAYRKEHDMKEIDAVKV